MCFPVTGELVWTPTTANIAVSSQLTLSIEVADTNMGSSVLVIPVLLCNCNNGGECLYDSLSEGFDNYAVSS